LNIPVPIPKAQYRPKSAQGERKTIYSTVLAQSMGKKIIQQDLVYKLLKQVPNGRITTYKALARAAGCSYAARAVGGMMRRNPYAPIVPCHRVVYSDGRLGGFGGSKGVKAKAKILEKEGVKVKEGRIIEFDTLFFDTFSTKLAEKDSLP